MQNSTGRNYSHCPLKKRPLSLYNEPAIPEQDEPEDLSIKRPRLSSPPPSVIKQHQPSIVSKDIDNISAFQPVHIAYSTAIPTIPSTYSLTSKNSGIENVSSTTDPLNLRKNYFSSSHRIVNPTPIKPEPVLYAPKPISPKCQQEKLPSLAEYYLQLFKSTSEAESKKKEFINQNLPPAWHHHNTASHYLPPSPQNSPTGFQVSPQGYPVKPSPVHHNLIYSPSVHTYPDTSALISPVSTCSSTTSESEEENVSRNNVNHNNNSRSNTRFTCDSCGKSYSTQSGLRKHNELHCSSLGPKAFSCKFCAKAYTSIGALKMHIRTHTLPCKCHVCGKAFSRPWLLQGHMRTHTGEKPFECTQCHRSFADRSNLRAHQQTHERIKKYACNICKKTFSRMSLLNKHSESSCVGIKLIESSPQAISTQY